MNSSLLRLLALMIAWGLAASLAGYFNLLFHLPPWVVPLLIVGLTVGFSAALHRTAWLRSAIATLGWRGLVAAHLVRFVGAAFLALESDGRLPALFAHPAGWGDLAAALAAIGLLLAPRVPRSVFVGWNLFGALDLLVAVGTAGWLNFTQPGSLLALSAFPLTLVPLWLVPVLFSSHLLMLGAGSLPGGERGSFPGETAARAGV